MEKVKRFFGSLRGPKASAFVAVLIVLTVGLVIALTSGSQGSGYGIDKGADRTHELAGVKAAAKELYKLTGGQVVVDTSRSSLVFSEEAKTATAKVKVGDCTTKGTFRNVPFETNQALTAADVGPLYIVLPHESTVVLETTGTGQLTAIRGSSLTTCLEDTTATPTAAAAA